MGKYSTHLLLDGYRQAKSSRGKGTVEISIPRAKFNPLELPLLIERLAAAQEGTK